ncbi:MAG: cytochrome c oxidase subunit 3 [Akkermansiaceae bacterium]|nr:cytochrome c oxidase subunit 3 [Akkermansiaceae bacterium]
MMFFAAFISAWMVVSAGATAWPPPDQPRLPVESTAFNTAALLASGVVLFLANRARARGDAPARVSRLMLAALALGAFFVVFQGYEWFRLLRYGLTMTSSTFGGFFYLIVGTHALHAVAAIVTLGIMCRRLRAGTLRDPAFRASQVFWYFVVGVWPVLYWLVYLSH